MESGVVTMVLDTLKKLSGEVNRKIEADEKVRDVVASKDRTILLDLKDDKCYVLSVKNGAVEEPYEGTLDEPTLKVMTDVKTIQKLIDGKMNPLMAYAMKKIKVEGPLDDVMILKDMF